MKRLLLLTAIAFGLAQHETLRAQFPFRLGGIAVDYGKDLAVDTQGNIILAGYFSAVADFDPGPAVSNLTAVGAHDNYLAKFDSQGKLLWVAGYGGSGVDIPHSVSVDASGSIYVAGYFSTTCDFNPGPGVTNLTSAGGRDAYVAKFTATGGLVWARGFGGATNDALF